MSFEHQQAKAPSSGTSSTRPPSTRAKAPAPLHSNQAVSRYLSAPAVQTKLTVNTPGDEFEREADRVAAAVTQAPQVQRKCSKCADELAHSAPRIQRMCSKCASEEEEHVQMKSQGSHTPEANEQQVAQARSGGVPLPTPVRTDFEQRFDHDFSSVRIHSGTTAAQSAQSLNASAYTIGSDIVFGQGQYSPSTSRGQRLLAHELTHVIQQGQGAPLQVQRQESDDLPPIPRPGIPTPGQAPAPAGPPQTPTVAINEPPEPGCPQGGTNLGNLLPDPPCAEGDEIVDGFTVKFCRDSDVFATPADRDRVRNFASTQLSQTTFKMQAWASLDGPGAPDAAHQYNQNLSCHRGKRVARELANAGVLEERISLVAKGPTDRFDAGTTEAHRANNRVVVVNAQAPAIAPATPLPTGATLQQTVNLARQEIINGNYNLGADAYVARWTCGLFRSLSDIVERTTVEIEGRDFPRGSLKVSVDPRTQVRFSQGEAEASGLNTIRLAEAITSTTDPLMCAKNRIADLAFHHFARPQIASFDEVHAGALHLLSLAGFGPCTGTLGSLSADFDPPRAADPKAGLAPPCAEAPLPGAINPQRQTGSSAPRPTFNVDTLDVTASSGALTRSQGPSLPAAGTRLDFITLDSPAGAITVNAQISATGDPREIPKYDIGFVQTITSENRFVTYVGGQRIRWKLPFPMRDGPPQGIPASDPPWFDRRARGPAQPGTFNVQMSDSPSFANIPTRFVDLSQTTFARQRTVPGLPGTGTRLTGTFDPTHVVTDPATRRSSLVSSVDSINPARDMRRTILFNTWVVARRNTPPAPVSAFSTEFLAGKVITFASGANLFTSLQGGVPVDSANGRFQVSATDADPGLASSVQLRGATPADFFPPGRAPLFNEFLVQEGAATRLQAPGGMDHSAFGQQLEAIAAGPRTTRGLRQPLTVTVRIDLSTGRVQLDDLALSNRAIRIATGDGSVVPAAQLLGLAQDIFPEARRLVFGHDTIIPDAGTGVTSVSFSLGRIP
jgi:outer membrane protein OmpA-like peptidoglycan-associated protein